MLPESDLAQEQAEPVPRRSWALPLSLQILGWFFLNMVVAGCVVVALFHAQAAPILNALIAGGGGDRLESIAAELGERLAPLPRTRWPELMAGAIASCQYGRKRATVSLRDSVSGSSEAVRVL